MKKFAVIVISFCAFVFPLMAYGMDDATIHLSQNGIIWDGSLNTSLKIAGLMTVLSIAPAMLMMLTSFTRIVIVLALLRQAFGMQQTPPNMVMMSLALFLTLFSMMPTLQQIDTNAYEPYVAGKMNDREALTALAQPIKAFMLKQTKEKELALMFELAKTNPPANAEEVSFIELIPAFMLSELKAAFTIGFMIFLPFLLIDLLVSSTLMAMGMIMVPPMSISLPLKILVFVLIDGWDLVVRALIQSFH